MSGARLLDFLLEFDSKHIGLSKGALSMIVTINRRLSSVALPANPTMFQTDKQGQIAGLGGNAVKRILADYGITRTLASEGGRTSRGNMERMIAYVSGINDLHKSGDLDLVEAEGFWIGRIREYFNSEPFRLTLDPSKSIRTCVRELLEQAKQRQNESSGTMYVGAMMQHLVAAKLRVVAGSGLKVFGHAVADSPANRAGDIEIGDLAVHVTTAPSQPLVSKCESNLAAGLRPLVVTTADGIAGFRALCADRPSLDRVDCIEFEQFLAANLHERGGFSAAGRASAASDLIAEYNRVVEECESDPSMKIDFGD